MNEKNQFILKENNEKKSRMRVYMIRKKNGVNENKIILWMKRMNDVNGNKKECHGVIEKKKKNDNVNKKEWCIKKGGVNKKEWWCEWK